MASQAPLLIYDGDCGFCERWARRAQRWAGHGLQIEASQTAALRHPSIDPQRFDEAVAYQGPDGNLSWAALAAFQALALDPAWAWLPGLYTRLPGFAWISEAIYRWVAL